VNWKPLIIIATGIGLVLIGFGVGLLHLMGEAGITITLFQVRFEPVGLLLLALLPLIGLLTYFLFRKRRTLG
jgi:hypothetical protein